MSATCSAQRPDPRDALPGLIVIDGLTILLAGDSGNPNIGGAAARKGTSATRQFCPREKYLLKPVRLMRALRAHATRPHRSSVR